MCSGNRVLQDLEEHGEQVGWKNTPPAQASRTKYGRDREGRFPTYTVPSICWPWSYSQAPKAGDHLNICSSWHRWPVPAPGCWAGSHSSPESPESFSLGSWERFTRHYPSKLPHFVLILSDDDKFCHWGRNSECIYLTGTAWVTGMMHRLEACYLVCS